MTKTNPIELVLYHDGGSLVRKRRSLDLKAGVNLVDWGDIPTSIDATSTILTSLTDPTGTVVLEYSYLYDTVNVFTLLTHYLNHPVEAVTRDGSRIKGILISQEHRHGSAPGMQMFQQEDGRIILLHLDNIQEVHFPKPTRDFITRPVLRCWIDSPQDGKQAFELTFQANKLSWSANYNLLLIQTETDGENPQHRLDINGWAALSNQADQSFQDARVRLVAGDIHRVRKPSSNIEFRLGSYSESASSQTLPVEKREVFEYKVYEIARPVNLPAKESRQVEFIRATHVPAQISYVFTAHNFSGVYDNRPRLKRHDYAEKASIELHLKFSASNDGMKTDLPAGVMRIYHRDNDDSVILIGEGKIKHTPAGEDVRLNLGKAFDLVGERKQTLFHLSGDNSLEECFEIHLRNYKKQAVQIEVPQHLFRWGNWGIQKASHEYTQLDPSTIQFTVAVPAEGEVVIDYTVLYVWPDDGELPPDKKQSVR